MTKYNPLYTSTIGSCNFYLYGSEDIRNDNNIIITEKQSDKSIAGGIKDPKMGTTDYSYKCSTCNNTKGVCPGHFGQLKLKYPVKNILFYKEILKILKKICLKCKKLLKSGEKKKNTKNACKHCGAEIFKIKASKINKIIIEKISITGKITKLFNHKIAEILQQLTPDVVKKLGYGENTHPSKFILYNIFVPPNTARPELPKSTTMEKVNDDITILIQHLMKYNKSIEEIIPDEILPNLEEKYINMDLIYQGIVTGVSEVKNNKLKILSNTNKPMNDIISRLKHKDGRIRKNIMGRRVENMMRSVITGDSYIKLDEVGVPKSIAMSLFIPEIINGFNEKRLKTYYNNGAKVYPGCKSIKKKIDNKIYSIDKLHKLGYELLQGDIIYRHLIDGDSIGFNRQPSLLISNISTHYIKVLNKIETLTMNVSSCNLYNADFDGDQMNGILTTGIQAINESRELSYCGNWFIDFRNQTPMFGLFQDSLTGVAELTRSKIKINKWHSMVLLGKSNDKLLSTISIKEKTYNGRDLISLFIPSDINIKNKRPKIYLKQYANLMTELDKNDISVVIKNGILEKGILDSATVKQGKENSLFHMIYNFKGIKYTFNVLYEMQHLIHKFLLYNGFTIGMKDMTASENTIREIKRKNTAIIKAANNITDKLDKGNLIPPINMSLKDFYELQQIQSLNVSDDIVQSILSDMNFNDNGLAKLVLSGSKGKINHIISINGIIGAQRIKGKRAKQNFGFAQNRASPHFFRNDTSPQSRGYIENSYIEGIDASTFMFACYEGRQAMVNNAMSTQIAGYQNRICVKNLESIIVDNLFKSSKHKNIVQFIYGETGFDFRSLMHIKFPTIMLSELEFKKNYKTDIKKLNKIFQNKKIQNILDFEFKILQNDRMIYRKIFIKLEKTSMDSYLFSDTILLPVNFKNLLENISNIHSTTIKDILDPIYIIEKLTKFSDNLVYIYTNEYQKKIKKVMSKHFNVALNLLKQVMRSYLCISNLLNYNFNNSLFDILLDKIYIKLLKSLVDYGTPVGIIAAQASAEPLTQDVLNSKHKSGIGDVTKTGTLARIQEILGAKPTEKLKNPSMLIRVKSEYEENEIKMQELCNFIKEIKLKNFVETIQIFYENFANPIHPDYIEEKEYIKKYLKFSLGTKNSSSYIKWCIRFSINRNTLIFKNITLEEIIMALEKVHKNISFVYSVQNSKIIFIRCYIKYSYLKEKIKFNIDLLHCIKSVLLNTIIRGIEGILSTKISDMMVSYIDKEGAIKKKKIYVISTIGSNLEKILDLNFVDTDKTQTDSISEMEELFGIDCARNKIVNEIMYSMSAASRIHGGLFADEMTYTGKITAINRSGLNKREGGNIWLNMSFEGPVQIIQNAVLKNIKTDIADVSAPIMIGEAPIVGTKYNKIINNELFIKKYYKNIVSNIDELI